MIDGCFKWFKFKFKLKSSSRHRAGATCHVQLVHGHGHATTPLSDRSRLIDTESEQALQEAHYSYRDHNNDNPAFVRKYILIVIFWERAEES